MAFRSRFRVPSYGNNRRDSGGGGGFLDSALQKDIALAKRFGANTSQLEQRLAAAEAEAAQRAQQADVALANRFGYTEDVLEQRRQDKLRTDAAAARAKLRSLARRLEGDKNVRQAYQNLLHAADPNRLGNEDVVKYVEDARKFVRDYERAKRKSSSLGARLIRGAVSASRRTGLLKALELAGRPIEELQQAGYAAVRADLAGNEGFLGQSRALVGGLPGLGFTAGRGKYRRYVEDVNTQAERRRLTKKGELASFGELLTGRADEKLRGRTLSRYRKTDDLGRGFQFLPDSSSGAVDLGGHIAFDPLSYTPAAFGRLAQPGRLAARAGIRSAARAGGMRLPTTGRAARFLGPQLRNPARMAGREEFITGTVRGQALLNRVEQAAVRLRDPEALVKRIDGLSSEDAVRIVEAGEEGGVAAARAEIVRAFAEGTFNPRISLRRQSAVAATQGRVGLGKNVKVGTLRAKGRDFLERVAREDGKARATITTGRANVAAKHAVDSALALTTSFAPDFYQRVVRPGVEKLDAVTRMGSIWDIAQKSDIAAFTNVVEEELRRVVKGKPNLSKLDADSERILARLETLAAVLDGQAGEEARAQAAAELAQGYTAKGLRATATTGKAASGLGIRAPKDYKVSYSKETADLLDAHISTRIKDPTIAGALKAELAAANRKTGLGRIAAAVDALADNPQLAEEVHRMLRSTAKQAGQAGVPRAAGLGVRSPARAASKLILSMIESAPPTAVAFQGARNPAFQRELRAEAVDRWAMDLGTDAFARTQLRRAAAAASSEEELYAVIKNHLRREAQKKGVIPELVEAVLKENRKRMRAGKVTMVRIGENGEEILEEGVQTVAQRVEEIPLPDPADIRRTIDDLKAKAGSRSAGLRNIPRRFSDTKASAFLKGVHRNWKFIIVTNLYAPAIGATAGFIGADEEAGESKLSAALTGAAIGSVGFFRYLGRVVAIEEKMRYWFERGFTPVEWVPAVSKWYRNRGIPDLYKFNGRDLIRANADLTGHLRNPLFVSIGEGFVALRPKQARFVDSWWRIVNHQLHETDTMANILLRERAGVIARDAADREIAAFLKTQDGKRWASRMRSGHRGPKSQAEAVQRYRDFIEAYVPEDIAAARLSGEVSHETLKLAAKAGNAPEVIHGAKTWVIPKTWRQAAITRNNIASRFVLEGPTTKFNREPLAEHLYREEFLRLTDEGVEPERAARIAEEFAVRRTNAVMFNINDESRFARKVDWVFPFQQPREELLRVWGKTVLNKPGRTLQVGRLAALAFNNGKENGTFYHDPLRDKWMFVVPGSAYLSRVLGGTGDGMEAAITDMVFFAQGAYGINFIPSPGGPWWTVSARTILNTAFGEELYRDMPEDIKEILFPYGASGQLAPSGANRLWMSFTASPPPWEFASQVEQEDNLRNTELEVTKHLIAEHLRKHPEDKDWVPDEKTIQKATKATLRTWSLTTNLSPAAPRPRWLNAEEAQKVREAYTDPVNGKFDYRQAIKDHPVLEPYFRGVGKTVYTGPDDWKHWTRETDYLTDRLLHDVRYKRTSVYLKELQQARKDAKVWDAYWKAALMPGHRLEREEMLRKWREENPEHARKYRTDYRRDLELKTILNTYPRHMQQEAIDRWRKEYDVSHRHYLSLKRDVEAGRIRQNPWNEARDMEQVKREVDEKVRTSGATPEVIVAGLSPVEQVRYWDSQLLDLAYGRGGYSNKDAAQLLEDYYRLNGNRGQVFAAHKDILFADDTRGKLHKTKYQGPAERWLQHWAGNTRNQIEALYREINVVQEAIDKADTAGDWRTERALKEKRNALYDAIREVKNKQYRSVLDDSQLTSLEQEVKAAVVFMETGNKKVFDRMMSVVDSAKVFLPSNEEASFLKMPERIRAAYIEDLVTDLQREQFTKGKKFWAWLTDFQKDLLESNLPEEMVEEFKRQEPAASGSGGGQEFWGRTIGKGGGELAYAFELFKQYNKRPEGAKPPPGYDEYLKLPNNPVLRADFLDRHPKVAEWIKLGPLSNMPPVLRYIVVDIMVKHGRWEGETRSMTEITELAFAREQFARWNKRGDTKRPDAYDTWLNMPTGPEKAEFLRQHPEVQDWIRLGPMAQMPDEYQEVVRDIMIRYGEWSQDQGDSLGQVIAGYYRTPAWNRRAYLEQHPELVEYWAALRTPEEQRMHDLAERYFAIADVNARRLYLAAHPELQTFFIEQRTKRYERFLNKVAQYMGANPDLFEDYLERQEDVLAELLNQFAKPSLVREVPRLRDQSGSATGEAGRQRR